MGAMEKKERRRRPAGCTAHLVGRRALYAPVPAGSEPFTMLASLYFAHAYGRAPIARRQHDRRIPAPLLAQGTAARQRCNAAVPCASFARRAVRARRARRRAIAARPADAQSLQAGPRAVSPRNARAPAAAQL